MQNGILMKIFRKYFKTTVAIIIVLALLYPITLYHEKIWKVIDKIGALATGLALFAAMYQGYVAWKAANLTRQANFQNLFQQKFNLILEQHNNALNNIKEWSKHKDPEFNKMDTESLVKTIRGHEELSPYMRILYHTLKSVREELPPVEDTDKDTLILQQKRYTSLVRSFIPNETLMYIACNASVLNDDFFSLDGSEQYSYFHDMLNDYDFFEHLKMENHKQFHLEITIKKIVFNIYDDCFNFYQGTCSFDLLKISKNKQVQLVKEVLADPSFFICLSYNLKNKAIDTESDIEGNLTVKELIYTHFKKYIEEISEDGLLEYLSHKIKNTYEARISEIVAAEDKRWYNGLSYTIGFYDRNLICEFFTSAMKYDKDKNSLIEFRDNFQSALLTLITDSSSFHSDQKIYKHNVKKVHDALIKTMTLQIDRLINLRQKIEYEVSTKEIINYQKDALQSYMVKFKTSNL